MSKDTLTVNGITHKIWEWAKLTNIDYRVLKYRLRQEVPINELFIPQLKRGPKFRRKIGNPNALPYTWNKTSLGCYKLGCNCIDCMLVPEWFKKQCQMKKQVRELVRLYGVPDNNMRELI